jgi:hypothetical protein
MAREQWEYKTITVTLFECRLKDKEVDTQFSEIGKDGWELVSVTPVVLKGETISLIHTFKRLAERERTAGFTV